MLRSARRLFPLLTATAFAVTASAGACGSRSKPAATVPAESAPAGGGGYGGDAYGGDAYGGMVYGGLMGSSGPAEFTCVSGVPACDQLFTMVVTCAKTGTKIDEGTRDMVIAQMQGVCEQLKDAAASGKKDAVDEATKECEKGAVDAKAQMQEQLGCTL
jgi:hypothetical protein